MNILANIRAVIITTGNMIQSNKRVHFRSRYMLKRRGRGKGGHCHSCTVCHASVTLDQIEKGWDTFACSLHYIMAGHQIDQSSECCDCQLHSSFIYPRKNCEAWCLLLPLYSSEFWAIKYKCLKFHLIPTLLLTSYRFRHKVQPVGGTNVALM